jgi:hypothetical protein
VAEGRRLEVRASLAATEAAVRLLTEEVELLDQVAELYRRLVDAEITSSVKALENLQSEGVKAVFPDQDLKVRAEVSVVRGKVAVELVTSQRKENGDLIEGHSLDGFGGAVATLQSVLLRLALIFKRGLRPVLFLDETLPAFSTQYVQDVAAFLKVMCRRLGVDILVITHNDYLVETADVAYRVQAAKGHSVVVKTR